MSYKRISKYRPIDERYRNSKLRFMEIIQKYIHKWHRHNQLHLMIDTIKAPDMQVFWRYVIRNQLIQKKEVQPLLEKKYDDCNGYPAIQAYFNIHNILQSAYKRYNNVDLLRFYRSLAWNLEQLKKDDK